MNKLLVVALLIILGAGAAYVYMNQSPVTPDGATDTQVMRGEYTWQFTDAGEDPTDGSPHTKVSVVTPDNRIVQLGEYHGSCTQIKGSTWELQKGEIDGAICWWAGGGDEIGVFEEDSKIVIKHGFLDEGTAETPGMRGGFETFLTL